MRNSSLRLRFFLFSFTCVVCVALNEGDVLLSSRNLPSPERNRAKAHGEWHRSLHQFAPDGPMVATRTFWELRRSFNSLLENGTIVIDAEDPLKLEETLIVDLPGITLRGRSGRPTTLICPSISKPALIIRCPSSYSSQWCDICVQRGQDTGGVLELCKM